MQFFDSYANRPVVKPEMNDGKSKVETAGYVSAEKRITAMIDAGQRLIEARREAYDFEISDDIDEDDIPMDPTRSPDFDLADASRIAENLDLKFKKAKKASPVPPGQKDEPLPGVVVPPGTNTVPPPEKGG